MLSLSLLDSLVLNCKSKKFSLSGMQWNIFFASLIGYIMMYKTILVWSDLFWSWKFLTYYDFLIFYWNHYLKVDYNIKRIWTIITQQLILLYLPHSLPDYSNIKSQRFVQMVYKGGGMLTDSIVFHAHFLSKNIFF